MTPLGAGLRMVAVVVSSGHHRRRSRGLTGGGSTCPVLTPSAPTAGGQRSRCWPGWRLLSVVEFFDEVYERRPAHLRGSPERGAGLLSVECLAEALVDGPPGGRLLVAPEGFGADGGDQAEVLAGLSVEAGGG